MKTVAIICEYNPFHNGHLHQLEMIRSRFGEETRVIALMSGPFVQRGEPAVMSREARTRAALASGVSLVLEIPLAFATASARDFADGAVRLLSASGICRDLVCGAETDSAQADLERLAHVLHEEGPLYKNKLQEFLAQGLNYPAARERAVLDVYPEYASAWRPFFREPNNILALEYQMAIIRENLRRENTSRESVSGENISRGNDSREGHARQAPLTLYLLPRKGDDRNAELDGSDSVKAAAGESISGETTSGESVFASATAIRRVLASEPSRSQRVKALEAYVPPASLAALLSGETVLADQLNDQVVAALVSRQPEELLPYRYMEPGLAERLINTAREVASSGRSENFWVDASTRYYPQTRLRRAVLSWFLGITSEDWLAMQAEGPQFIRVCGMDKHGRYLVRLMRKTAKLPRIDKNSELLEALAETKTQQNLALRGEALYRLRAGTTMTIFDTYTEIL